MNTYDFKERLAFSRGIRESADIDTLANMIPNASRITKTDEDTDKSGADYRVELRGGGIVLIDAKARSAGAGRFWKNGPEVALETWSVKPGPTIPAGKVGWTLNNAKNTDLILFTFAPSDCHWAWLVSFHLLHIAFTKNLDAWTQGYRTVTQSSGGWQSECVFVPIPVVDKAISQTQRGRFVTTTTMVQA